MNQFWPGWRAFYPASLNMGRREFGLGGLGLGLGLLLTGWLSRQALGDLNPWFIAPMGASAVLLFLVPASPLAQPWSILGGNLVSALIGVSCSKLLGHGIEAAALAGALAAWAMLALRCLHPPGGAVALTAVLGGPAIEQLGHGFALWPVSVNSAFMLLVALLFNNATGRRYPHRGAAASSHGTRDPLPSHRGFIREDLDAALAGFGELLDIEREDLEEIMVRAQLHAQNRRWGELRCQDLMSRDVIRIGPGDSVDEAWRRLIEHRLQALPVTDSQGRLRGLVSRQDFFVGQTSPDPRRLPRLSAARRVESIMSTEVVTARPQQPLPELAKLFADGGRHHLPVLDEQRRVIGMMTPSDLLAVLFQTAPGPLTKA
mgnify:CR=1 FL=1